MGNLTSLFHTAMQKGGGSVSKNRTTLISAVTRRPVPGRSHRLPIGHQKNVGLSESLAGRLAIIISMNCSRNIALGNHLELQTPFR